MVYRIAPRIIRTDAELDRYTDPLFDVDGKGEASLAEMETINLLSLLVETYESKRNPMAAATPVEVLRYLMEQNGLQQRDLVEDLGSESNVSLILAGKRNLTVPHMEKLSRRFGVPASVFVESAAQAS